MDGSRLNIPYYTLFFNLYLLIFSPWFVVPSACLKGDENGSVPEGGNEHLAPVIVPNPVRSISVLLQHHNLLYIPI